MFHDALTALHQQYRAHYIHLRRNQMSVPTQDKDTLRRIKKAIECSLTHILLEDTMKQVAEEFGRTPTLKQYTSLLEWRLISPDWTPAQVVEAYLTTQPDDTPIPDEPETPDEED